MREALVKIVGDLPHTISIIDVDQDPGLLKLYDELVPVLFARKSNDANSDGAGQQLCHYFLDADKVKAFCHE
jgi:hypothetical protein